MFDVSKFYIDTQNNMLRRLYRKCIYQQTVKVTHNPLIKKIFSYILRLKYNGYAVYMVLDW